jgi:hypothetical protein
VTTARGYITEQHAPSTRRAYQSDIRIFATWCASTSRRVTKKACGGGDQVDRYRLNREQLIYPY